jgi:hypothetical protein
MSRPSENGEAEGEVLEYIDLWDRGNPWLKADSLILGDGVVYVRIVRICGECLEAPAQRQ